MKMRVSFLQCFNTVSVSDFKTLFSSKSNICSENFHL